MYRPKKKRPSERGITSAIAKFWPFFSKDAEPEEISEAFEDLIEAIQEEVVIEEPAAVPNDEVATKTESVQKEATANDEEMPQWAKALSEAVSGLVNEIKTMKDAANKDSDPLEKLEAELSGESPDESESDESEIIEAAENIEPEDGTKDFDSEENGEATFSKDAKAAALKEIKCMKPIIASIADEKMRKAMSDSAARLLRATYGLSPNKGGGNNYAVIMETRRRNAEKMSAKDGAATGDKGDRADIASQKIKEAREKQLATKY
jgi:hypothetical protein